jgi:hypothetical protein
VIDPCRSLVHRLISRGHIDVEELMTGSVSMTELGRRNSGFKVYRAHPRRSLFVKFGRASDDAGMKRESHFYRLVFTEPALEAMRSLMVSSALDQHAEEFLCIDLLLGTASLFETFQSLRRLSVDTLAQLGKVVGTFHRLSPVLLPYCRGTITTENRLPWAFAPDISFGIDRRFARHSDQRILSLVCDDAELLALLHELPNAWHGDSLIHGDLKWDNCLLVDRPEDTSSVKLIDWESLQVGDAAWDIAGIFHDFFHAWIWSMPTSGLSHERRIKRAGYAIADLREDIGLFWKAYVDEIHPVDPEGLLNRSIRFAGARLIEASLQHERHHESLTRHSVLLLELCRNLIANPHDARKEFIAG